MTSFFFFWLQYDCRSLKHHILPQKLLKFVSASSHFNSKRNFLRISQVSLAHFWTNYWQHNNIITRPNSNQSAFCFSKLFLLLKHSRLTMLVSGVQQSIFLQIIYNYRLSQDTEYSTLCYTVAYITLEAEFLHSQKTLLLPWKYSADYMRSTYINPLYLKPSDHRY